MHISDIIQLTDILKSLMSVSIQLSCYLDLVLGLCVQHCSIESNWHLKLVGVVRIYRV